MGALQCPSARSPAIHSRMKSRFVSSFVIRAYSIILTPKIKLIPCTDAQITAYSVKLRFAFWAFCRTMGRMAHTGSDNAISRRSFLKGLGVMALMAMPACKRAQQFAVQPEDCPEWMLPGEATCFATCMPWATGAIPMLAVCHEGVPVALQSNPRYESVRRGLPAFAQAALLDLFSTARMTSPLRAGKPHPMSAFRASLRAWGALIKEGRKIGFLFPAGYSAVRMAQVNELRRYAGVSCYEYDPAAAPRPTGFAELESLQNTVFGAAVRFADKGFEDLATLTARLPRLDVLFIFTPADPAAFDADFAKALSETAAETIRFVALQADETARLCLYRVPSTHFLEEWGADADAYGNLCLRQPIMAPAHGALSEFEVLHALLHQGELPAADGSGISTARGWLDKVVPDVESALKTGYVANAAPKPELLPPAPAAEVNLYLHPYYADGRFRHNVWLQETYLPLSGWAGMPEAFLPGASIPGGVGVRNLHLPAWFHKKLSNIWLPLLPECVGVSREQIRLQEAPPLPYRAADPEPPVQRSNPSIGGGPSPQWAMVIDLSRCIGCGACALACRAENNIPTVGVEEMRYNRDLQWLHINRYLRADQTQLFVPVACRHCEKAPCEAVCPVNATMHTTAGLNAMVYPRCWGTRYCAAACPYHARVFNFRDYAKEDAAKTQRSHNPQVTVRSRGVMEKCTYCVQRINAAANNADAAPQTACQQACPTGAIKLINLCNTPLPPQVISSFDVEGTHPRTLYI